MIRLLLLLNWPRVADHTSSQKGQNTYLWNSGQESILWSTRAMANIQDCLKVVKSINEHLHEALLTANSSSWCQFQLSPHISAHSVPKQRSSYTARAWTGFVWVPHPLPWPPAPSQMFENKTRNQSPVVPSSPELEQLPVLSCTALSGLAALEPSAVFRSQMDSQNSV